MTWHPEAVHLSLRCSLYFRRLWYHLGRVFEMLIGIGVPLTNAWAWFTWTVAEKGHLNQTIIKATVCVILDTLVDINPAYYSMDNSNIYIRNLDLRSNNSKVNWWRKKKRRCSLQLKKTKRIPGLQYLFFCGSANVLFDFQYTLIDCRSTHLSAESSCHLTIVGIARLLSLDHQRSRYERAGKSDSVQSSPSTQSVHHKKSIFTCHALKADNKTHTFLQYYQL